MIRLIAVAVSAILLILFVAFVVSRLLRTRSRGMSIRMQVFLALAVIVGAFAFAAPALYVVGVILRGSGYSIGHDASDHPGDGREWVRGRPVGHLCATSPPPS